MIVLDNVKKELLGLGLSIDNVNILAEKDDIMNSQVLGCLIDIGFVDDTEIYILRAKGENIYIDKVLRGSLTLNNLIEFINSNDLQNGIIMIDRADKNACYHLVGLYERVVEGLFFKY